LHDVGAAIERVTNARGFHVARELTGHGIGSAMHEPPTMFNWPAPFRTAKRELTEGLVFTIEPDDRGRISEPVDPIRRRTVRDGGGALSTHEEHTVVVCPDGLLVLTAPKPDSQPGTGRSARPTPCVVERARSSH
jgi:methionyl aminopeptidase